MKFFIFPLSRLIIGLLVTLSGLMSTVVLAEDSAKTLYEKSLVANVLELRGYYRKKLADTYPDTAYGLYARGWLASMDGNDDESIRLYRRSIQKGHVAMAYNNLRLREKQSPEDEAELIRLSMKYAIENNDPLKDYAVYVYFDHLHTQLKTDAERQQLYVRLGQSRSLSERLAGMYIRALIMQEQGRYEEALAVIYDEDPAHTNNDLIDLELEIISQLAQQQRFDTNQTLNLMFGKRDYLLEVYEADDPKLEYYYLKLYRETKKLTNNRNFPLKIIQLAYNVRQSPGLLSEMYNAMWLMNTNGETLKPLLDDITRRFPDFGMLRTHLALYYANIENNPQKMFVENEKAIKYAYSNSNKAGLLSLAVEDSLKYGLVKEAEQMIERDAIGLNYANTYAAQLDVALINQNFSKARKLLTQATANDINLIGYYESLTSLGENNQQSLQKHLQDNPFLTNWDKEFGGSLSLAIEFPINSSVIPKKSYSALDKAARALKQIGGDKYIFRIEGHTDPTGGNKINLPLSKKRAESVRQYLISRHGIDAGRLQSIGMGDIQPVATNLTEEGRKRNRRVDIRPYGNISEPQLVTRGFLDTRSAMFSNDGRFMATGQTPITLWDTRYGVRLRELYKGGNQRQFSPNNRYLAAMSSATDMRGVYVAAIYVTDIKTGDFAAIIPIGLSESTSGGNLAWSPDSNQIAYTDNKGGLFVFDIRKQRLVNATPMSSVRISGQVKWTKDGQYIVTAQAQRKDIDIFDAKTLAKVITLPGINWAHGMGLSDDGKVLLVSNNDSTLTLYDTLEWQLIDVVKLPVRTAQNIFAIPGTTKVLMDDKFEDKGVSIFDYKTRKWDLKTQTDEKSRLGVNPDGENIWVVTENEASLVNRKTMNVEYSFQSASDKAGGGLSFNKTEDLLFAQDEEGANIWHVSQARLVQRIQIPATKWVQDSDVNNRWWSVADSGDLLSFSTTDFAVKRYPGINFKPSYVKQNGSWLAVAEDVDSQGASNAKVAIFNLETLQLQTEISVDLITAPLRHGNGVYSSGIVSMAIDAKKGTLYLASWWYDRFETVSSKNIQSYHLKNGSSAGVDALSPQPIDGLSLEDMDPGFIQVTTSTRRFNLELASNQSDNYKRKDWGTIKLKNDKTLKYGSFILENENYKRTLKDNILNIVADEDRNLVIVQSTSNVLTYYSLDTLEPRLFVHFKKDGEWLAADTRGYFTSSLNGTNGTYWSLGDNFLPFESLRDKYENPRGVQESLAALFNGQKPIDPQPIIEPDILDLPFDIQVTSVTNETTDNEVYKLTLKITKNNKNVPDPTVYYLVNGRKSRGFDSDPFADLDESLTFVRTVPLSVGENKIEAIVKYKDVDVAKEIVTITRKAPPRTNLSKNTLWYFGVGVSEYANSLQNLDFADRDALELEKAFKAQKGRLFGNVHTKVLVNSDATARDIKIQLYDFLSQAQPDDNIVIFIAGHGVQDSSQALYFMPHDGELKRPFTGMGMQDFKNFLDQRPINQKALFLMDICHAGAFDNSNSGRLSSEDVIKKLSSGTATTVFSSSTGAQQSLEDERFGGGHGAFTYAILQALKGAADNQAGDEDGIVSLMEMIFYTKKEVSKLTNKAQQPTVPVMGSFQDYPISASQ